SSSRIASFSSAVCLDLGIQKSLHNHQMNYCISSDNHKGIIAILSLGTLLGGGLYRLLMLLNDAQSPAAFIL
ncbi:MAG: hypothetical protein LKJ69_11990, partial [Lactobacillus sp.]|nr:hypothetical protein [Lactobacillus sp.]MCI2034087.1 hypothetical protein [Lactobacillus sp.]